MTGRPRPRALTALFAVALAACGGSGQEAAAPSPVNAVAPQPSGDAGLAAFRAEWLAACVGGARDAAPPGAPIERHCACAIDRVMVGRSLAELEAERDSGAYAAPFQAEMRACIAEIRR